MLSAETWLYSPLALFLVAVIVVAALAHGTLGFGFPIISTPVVAMMTDLKSAIILTLFPNIAVNLISIVVGGNWHMSIAKYWPVALYVLLGTVVGTHMLLLGDPEPLKLFLAVMIVVYLQQARLRKLDWSWLVRHRHGSALLFGSLGGFLAGTVNVTLPPLVIYFMALGMAAVPMTQILNLCFLVGKATQAITLGMSDQIDLSTLVDTAPLTLVAATTLLYGMRIRNRIHPETYQALLRKILWAMACILTGQVVWHYAAR